jgi:NADPH:quinone reductase-like Zn-dependent oxidoreductase
MRAIRFDHFGSPSELQVQDVLKPEPKENEVLIEVRAASVNPSDVKNIQGAMKSITTLPRIPGRDFAGVIVAGAQDWIGKEVWGTGGDLGFTRDGTHAEFLLLPIAAVRPKPQTLSMEQAASVGVTFVTAWLCVMEAAQAKAGETLLVIGATGGVGSAAVQIAKWKGLRVLGTVRRDRDRDVVQQSGVDVAINSETEDLSAAVKAATHDRGADIIIDTVGGEMVLKALPALAPKGRLTEISIPPQQQQVNIDLLDFYRRQLRLLGVNSLAWDAQSCAGVLEALTPGFEADALRLAASIQSYGINEASKAYEQVQTRSTSSKVVLTPKP